MGKRSDFERVDRDFYPTPAPPVHDLAPYLSDVRGYVEPCAGDGQLIVHMESLGHQCTFAADLSPVGSMYGIAVEMDALDLTEHHCIAATHIITNPPWPAKFGRGEPTLGLIRHWSKLRPTWLLLAADFAHNGYAAEVLAYCDLIVPVGRVKWIEDSRFTGKDNAAWYRFDQRTYSAEVPAYTRFAARGVRRKVFASDIEDLL